MPERRDDILQTLLALPGPDHNRSKQWLDYLALSLTEAGLPELLALLADERYDDTEDEQAFWVTLLSLRQRQKIQKCCLH